MLLSSNLLAISNNGGNWLICPSSSVQYRENLQVSESGAVAKETQEPYLERYTLRFLFQVPKALKNNSKTKKVIYKRIFTYEWCRISLWSYCCWSRGCCFCHVCSFFGSKDYKQRESIWYVPNYLTPERSNDTRRPLSILISVWKHDLYDII